MYHKSLETVNDIRNEVHSTIEDERAQFCQDPRSNNGNSSGPFSSMDLAEYSAIRFLDSPPPPIVYHLEGPGSLRAGIFGMILADGGMGKGHLVTQLALSTGTDIPFLDGLFRVNTKGRAVVIYGEDDHLVLHHRFTNIVSSLLRFGEAENLREQVRENVFLMPVCGEDVRLMTSSDGDLVETPAYQNLLGKLTGIDDLRLVVLDPMSRFFAGDENSPTDATRFSTLMEKISLETGSTTLTTHHPSKSSVTGKTGLETLIQHASRGSTAFVNAARWQLSMARIKDGECKRLGIPRGEVHKYMIGKVTKSNDSALSPHFYLRRDDNGCLRHVILREKKSGRDEEVSTAAIAQIRDDEIRGKFYTARAFARSFSKEWNDYGGRRLERLIDRAILDGFIKISTRKNRQGKELDYLTLQGGKNAVIPDPSIRAVN